MMNLCPGLQFGIINKPWVVIVKMDSEGVCVFFFFIFKEYWNAYTLLSCK